MPRVGVTKDWVWYEISELTRICRRYMSSSDYDSNFSSRAASIASLQATLEDLQEKARKVQAYIIELNERVDAK